MSKLSNDDRPLDSALKEGLILGILATLKQFDMPVTKQNITKVLKYQQNWPDTEIQYFMSWLLLFNIQD